MLAVDLAIWGTLATLLVVEPSARANLGQSSEDSVYAVRSPTVLRYATAAEARAHATNVLEVAVDHVAVPRGLTGGPCHIEGRVVRVERGAGLTPRGRIALSVPCVARPRPGEPRRIPEGEFAEGSSSLFYFSEQQDLLDIARIRE